METPYQVGEEIQSLQRDIRQSLEWQFFGIQDWELIAHSPNKPSPTMTELAQKLRHCVRCALHVGRTNAVLGMGSTNARICIVGPPPNSWDDAHGKPFQGPPGELLEKMVHAMQLPLEDFYYLPIVSCRPPKDRLPQGQEVDACETYVLEQIKQIQPQVVLAMGELPAQTLFRTEADLPHLRGKWGEYQKIPLLATWDPASILKKTSLKKEVWYDLKMVLKKLKQ